MNSLHEIMNHVKKKKNINQNYVVQLTTTSSEEGKMIFFFFHSYNVLINHGINRVIEYKLCK